MAGEACKSSFPAKILAIARRNLLATARHYVLVIARLYKLASARRSAYGGTERKARGIAEHPSGTTEGRRRDFQSSELSRVHRDRLLKLGFLLSVGLHIPVPGALYWQRPARLEEKDWPPLPAIQVVGYVKVVKRRL
jgi:hypothetical protein